MANSLKRLWTLNQDAFEQLLRVLDVERESAGRKYEDLRHVLVRFFECRGTAFPEELADETLDRIARKIVAGEQIRDVNHYSLGVARLVVLEAFKRKEKAERTINEFSRTSGPTTEDIVEIEKAEGCLRRCLDRLPRENRELVMDYYQGSEGGKASGRKSLAVRLGLTSGNLRMRVLRLRKNLEECVKKCLEVRQKSVTNGPATPLKGGVIDSTA